MVFRKKVQPQEEEFEEPLEVPTPEPVRPINRVQPVQQRQVQEPIDNWSVEEIPTATAPIIYNASTRKTYTLMEAIAEILNRSEE